LVSGATCSKLLGELVGLLLSLLGGKAGLGALGVDAHGVDHSVGTAAAGQLAQHLDRVLGVEVDRLGALAAGRFQARGLPVDGQDPPRPLEQGTVDGELAHWAQPSTATMSPLLTSASLAPNQAVGKMSDSMIAWSSVTSSGSLTRPTLAKGTRTSSACMPSKGPLGSGPPKKAVPAWEPLGLATSHWA
jgi:hypothetical protein